MIQAHLNSINSRHANECAFSYQIITTKAISDIFVAANIGNN